MDCLRNLNVMFVNWILVIAEKIMNGKMVFWEKVEYMRKDWCCVKNLTDIRVSEV